MPFTLPPLPYSKDALAPVLSQETLDDIAAWIAAGANND